MLPKKTTNETVAGHAIEIPIKGATYHGKSPKDIGYRVKTNDGQKLLVFGTAYELKPHSLGSGKHGFKRIKIGTTQDYVSCLATDISFVATCKKTNKRIRLIGRIKPIDVQTNQEPTKPMPMNTVDTCSGTISPATTNSMQPAPADPKQRSHEQRQLARFQRELEIISAQCKAGLNPPVSIAAMGYMSHRSHATIYRDIKKQLLPRPTKIGRNSTFPFSIAKAYADGQFVGGAV